MKNFLLRLVYDFKIEITNIPAFLVSLVFSSFFYLLASLHYLNIYNSGHLLWISWVSSLLFLFVSFIPQKIPSIKFPEKSLVLIILFATCLYWISHLVNFSIAPWNQYGLFDDAAWDIYFANNHAFVLPFQPAFFDTVGYISREVVFHYYISIFFRLFGYNLVVFNFALLFLGYITVLFTTLIIHKLFKNIVVTIISFVVINFFPLHFLHIFMGHRYAIAAPLMLLSLYFLYTSYISKSYFRAIFSALFAAFCWASAIMGKQYLIGLIIAAPIVFVIKRKSISEKDIRVSLIWILSLLISAAPMIIYVLLNYPQYTLREQGLLREFISSFQNSGLIGISPYWEQLSEIFFAPFSSRRQFLQDFYSIPLSYYGLLLPGLIIAVLKKRIEIVLLSLIPLIGALLSGSYDFRIVLAVPIWIISMAFSIDHLVRGIFKKHNFIRSFEILTLFILIIAGLAPSIDYIWNVSKDTKHLYLLDHKAVAVSRIFQDIVVGAPNPSIEMKQDELRRKVDMGKVSYDTLISPHRSYAVAHLYLQNFDDKKVLSFNDQGIQLLKTPQEILNNNISAIMSYKVTNKDLKLVWELSDKTPMIIEFFSRFNKYGVESRYSGTIEGEHYDIYTLTIYNKNIEQFKKDIKENLQSLYVF